LLNKEVALSTQRNAIIWIVSAPLIIAPWLYVMSVQVVPAAATHTQVIISSQDSFSPLFVLWGITPVLTACPEIVIVACVKLIPAFWRTKVIISFCFTYLASALFKRGSAGLAWYINERGRIIGMRVNVLSPARVTAVFPPSSLYLRFMHLEPTPTILAESCDITARFTDGFFMTFYAALTLTMHRAAAFWTGLLVLIHAAASPLIKYRPLFKNTLTPSSRRGGLAHACPKRNQTALCPIGDGYRAAPL
jgi:hypothetical protein